MQMLVVMSMVLLMLIKLRFSKGIPRKRPKLQRTAISLIDWRRRKRMRRVNHLSFQNTSIMRWSKEKERKAVLQAITIIKIKQWRREEVLICLCQIPTRNKLRRVNWPIIQKIRFTRVKQSQFWRKKFKNQTPTSFYKALTLNYSNTTGKWSKKSKTKSSLSKSSKNRSRN